MEITEVRIKLMEEPGERLKAFCSVTFDNCFVVRDLKIIDGSNGPFVAMPSRKLTSHCPRCRTKNHLRAQHCNQCGAAISTERMPLDMEGRAKLYADIAHPINSACRELIQEHVLRAFNQEIELSRRPDYVSRYDDFDLDIGESRPATPARTPEMRVDKAHDQRGTHTPRTGGASEHAAGGERGPTPPSKSSAHKRPAQRGGGFGAGIFSED